MDDDELIGLDRWRRVFDRLEQQNQEFLSWVALIMLTECDRATATTIVGGADDLFPLSRKVSS